MSSTTSRLALYLAGGGSTGQYGADETADIDKINANFVKIDGAVGVLDTPDSSLPANPYVGQVVHATTSDGIVKWNGSNWVNFFPNYLQAGTLGNTFVSYSKVGTGALDTRYYTQNNLLNDGVIDGRYPAKNAAAVVSQRMLTFKVQSGSYTATTTTDPTRGYSDNHPITFQTPFAATPIVVMTPLTGATAEQHWGIISPTSTGFTGYYWRADTVDPTINWIAIGV